MTKNNIIITRDKKTDTRLDEQFFAWYPTDKFSEVYIDEDIWASDADIEGFHLDFYLLEFYNQPQESVNLLLEALAEEMEPGTATEFSLTLEIKKVRDIKDKEHE